MSQLLKYRISLPMRLVFIVLFAFISASCSSYRLARQADAMIAQGQTVEGIRQLQDLARKDPASYRLRYLSARDSTIAHLLERATQLHVRGDADRASDMYRQVLQIDEGNPEALRALELLVREKEHSDAISKVKSLMEKGASEEVLALLSNVLAENPGHAEAKRIRRSLEVSRQRTGLSDPVLRSSLRKPVSLEFRNASLQAVFEVLSRSSGVSFIFDKDIKADVRTTIFARDTSVEDALQLILRTNQMAYKVLNESTVLVYPSTGDKEKQYEDLVVRTFYLGSAEPKKVQDMIRALVAPRSMYVDDSLKILVVRDTLPVIDTIERIVDAYDLAAPEVTLDVEIIEVSDDSLLNVGLQYPDQISASVSGAAAKPGQLTIGELENINRSNFTLFVPDPFAVLNLKQTSGKTNTLANPKIRVRSREKAKVLIGDKVPVITTTTNQTSGSTSESVSYLDVGLKLEVEPEVHVNDDVSIAIGLEVSSIVKEVKSTTGLLTYQIGTRNANTVLRLRDGETQMLAGLIKDERRDSATHLPGIGRIPLIGRLFSNETNNKSKSEIVLLITPHIVRSLATPDASTIMFPSGTGSRISTQSLRLGSASQYSSVDAAIVPMVTTGGASKTVESASANPLTDSGGVDNELKLEIVAPESLAVGREFTVALMANGAGFGQLSLQLDFDQSGVELVQAVPVAKVSGFDADAGDQSLAISMTGGAPYAGPLCMVTLRALRPLQKPLAITLRKRMAQTAEGADIPVLLPGSRLVRVLQ